MNPRLGEVLEEYFIDVDAVATPVVDRSSLLD